MQLKELTKAVNNLDKAMAATSYGNGVNLLRYVIPLLPIEDQTALAQKATELAEIYLINSRKKLEDLNIEIGKSPRPEEYRIFFTNDKLEIPDD